MNEVTGYIVDWKHGKGWHQSWKVSTMEEALECFEQDQKYFYNDIQIRILECRVVHEGKGKGGPRP